MSITEEDLSGMPQPNSFSIRGSAPGQGGLVAIAVSMVVALVLAATTISGLSYLNAKRSVATMKSLQSYYVAQAGLQEAVATRMLPGTNYLSYMGTKAKPYYTYSGTVYRDPVKRTGVVGYYRFVVVGGDGARKSDGSYYSAADVNNSDPDAPQSWLLETDIMPTDSPFVVISNGLTCVANTGTSLVGTDQFVDPPAPNNPNPTPTCKSGYTLDQTTLVARALMMQGFDTNNAPIKDRITRVRSYRDSTKLRLPSNAFVPGYGWTNTSKDLSFDTIWDYQSSGDDKNPAQLNKVVFYNFLTDQIDADVSVTGSAVTVSDTVPSDDSIRLYFNGPIDYRTVDPQMDPSLANCKSNPKTCRVRVMKGATAVANNTFIPVLPSSTQLILLAPLGGAMAGGNTYQLNVDAKNLKSFTGQSGTLNYVITFKTN